LLTYFAEQLGLRRGALPVAEEIGDRTLSLPMFPTLGEDEQDRVVAAVAAAWAELAAARA
jgi:UDP-4-amino-4-deoxy-L-arabinose-oxoglutarate aminotransferase